MKAITQSIFGSVVTVLLGVTFFGSINGQTASLTGEQAVKQLRETGSYDSLRAAFNDAQKHSGDKPLRPEVSQTKLIASDGAASDFFGTSVAISGETAIVGSARDDIGANIDQGSAYVFVRNGTTWTKQTKLIAADGEAADVFGFSVAISGDTAIVGSYQDDIGANANQGSAYVFVRNGTTWTQQTKLIATDGAAFDFFGISVAISGETVIVGSFGDYIELNANQGSACVFIRSGTTWTQQIKLIAADGEASDGFGISVAISGERAIVGSSYDDIDANINQGSAYVFVRSGTTWTQQTKLIATDGAAIDLFGISVAISGETAIVGSVGDYIGVNGDQGSAYVFVRNGTTWTQQVKLIAVDGAAGDQFGWSVAISGDTAIVGSVSDNIGATGDQGSAYVFVRNGTTWAQQVRLIAVDGAAIDFFGISVAISGETAIVGSSYDDIGANIDQGSAYIFNSFRTRPLYDFDGDGKADVSVFRPSNGGWYINQSMSGFTGIAFGQAGDKIVPADYDGDGKTDVAVYRGGTWYLNRSLAGFSAVGFGIAEDIPQPADFNNDGRAELAVFRPSNGTWYVLSLVTNQFSFVQFGQNGDKPVVADYDGDGRADYAVYRNGSWYILRSSQGFLAIQFGISTDKPVPADYDGDGKADVAVFRQSNGTWYLNRSQAGFAEIQFGISSDIPAPADYDGDARADLAVFREGAWYLQRSTAGFFGIQFGSVNDQPVPSAFVP